MNLIKLLISGACLAVCYVSGLFLSDVISNKSELLMLLYLLCTAAVYALLMLSKNAKTALLKWLCSLPFAYLCFVFFWHTEFYLRGLNWVSPGYGRPSAGANFAGFMQLMLLTVLCFIAWLAGLCRHPKQMETIARLQRLIGGIWCAGTVAAVLWLESVFPPYSAVLADM